MFEQVDDAFCSQWNPDYSSKSSTCCRPTRGKRGRMLPCDLRRVKWSFCDELTQEQHETLQRSVDELPRDPLPEIELRLMEQDLGSLRRQAYCSIGNGFLVQGRPVIPSEENRLIVKNPRRCTQFGTDLMVAMLEWTGRQIARDYPSENGKSAYMILGDLSAPRGGCISGRRGRRGHKSHTNGKDVDLGFLAYRTPAQVHAPFDRRFDPAMNWQMLKRVFENPYVCIKSVFVDRAHIKKLRQWVQKQGDPDWARLGPLIRHVRSHRGHFHIRIGEGPGLPGCPEFQQIEGEEDEEMDGEELSQQSDPRPRTSERRPAKLLRNSL
jgi:murein endopeptidase